MIKVNTTLQLATYCQWLQHADILISNLKSQPSQSARPLYFIHNP